MTWIVAEPIDEAFILYTYEITEGKAVCHAYGPMPHDAAENLGGWLKNKNAGLQFMVLQLLATPSQSPEGGSA